MNIVSFMKWSEYIVSSAVLIFGFLLLYYRTQEPISSFVAAILSAALVFVSLWMIRWLMQVFFK